VTAWPRSAQLTTAFLLGICGTLLTVQAWNSLRWSSRPADLERGTVLTYRIDVNHADRAELLQLPGVGPATADHIEEHRRQHGNFRSVDDLMQVHGIGPATLARLRPWVCVRLDDGDEESAPAETAPRQPVKKPASTTMAASGTKSAGKKESLNGTIDINRAGMDELQKLPGVGPKTAQKIVDERNSSKGPFKSVDELRRVNGIGVKTLDKLRPYVRVAGESVPVVAAE